MANEVTTAAGSAGELVAAEIVSRLVIDAAYAQAVMPSICKSADISGEATKTVEFPKWPLLSASGLTEATDLSNTAVNTTSASVTVAETGLMITITDLLLNSSAQGIQSYAAELGKALANQIDTDLLAEVADFTASVGASGSALTEAIFLESIYELDNGDAIGPFAAVMHPIQIDDLRKAIVASTGAVWGNPSMPAADLGAFTQLHGIDVFKSTNCASVNSDADRQGVIMPRGEGSGLAYVMKAGANVEFQRDASLRATEVVVVATYGDECVNTAANGGVSIITDHE